MARLPVALVGSRLRRSPSPTSEPRRGVRETENLQPQAHAATEPECVESTALRKGLVSVQVRNGWPQNVWAVASSGVPIEAMLDNEVTGSYHGYPMLEGDPLREEILRAWGNHD